MLPKIVVVKANSLTTAFPKFDDRNVWPQLGFTLFIACFRCLGRNFGKSTQLWGQCLAMFLVKNSQVGTAGLAQWQVPTEGAGGEDLVLKRRT